jgi:hypothetical protein
MRKNSRTQGFATGGEISSGKADAVRPGNRRSMPSEALSLGRSEATRSGPSSRSLSLGRSTGGHGSFQEKFATGGDVHKSMKAIYEALHSHFANEPQMKRLGANRSNTQEGEPHRATASAWPWAKRAAGGRMRAVRGQEDQHLHAIPVQESVTVMIGRKRPKAAKKRVRSRANASSFAPSLRNLFPR